MAKADSNSSISVQALDVRHALFCIVGASPLIFNRMAEKAKRELLQPQKKNKAEREGTAKHDPLAEYRASVYRTTDDAAPTRLVFPSPAFKGALATAALETPGATKTAINRLCWVEGTHVPVYGVPELYITTVRSANMQRTPDIRTRAIVPRWACAISVNYVTPNLPLAALATLLKSAGLIVGIGDFRQEKGKGSHGQFRIANADDPEYLAICAAGGRVAQDEALDCPTPYDEESEELLTWYATNVPKMGKLAAA